MSSRPQTVSEVLCNEVGANHPDGALQQIRTMKRVLRSHYRAQRRLEAFGVNGVGDSVTHITALRSRIDTLRADQKRRARANIAAIDEALDTLSEARERLRNCARPWHDAASSDEAPQAADSASRPGAASEADPPSRAPEAPRASSDVIAAVRAEIEELRLELWAEQADGDASSSNAFEGTLAPPNDDLLDLLAHRLQRLEEATVRLRKEKERLQNETQELRDENRQLQLRITTLEQRLRHQDARLRTITRRFVESDTVDA